MLRDDQIEIIRKYVPEKYFNQNKLIKYLSLHNMVGVEVFAYTAKDYYKDGLRGCETVLPTLFKENYYLKSDIEEDEKYRKRDEFVPEDVDTFVRRIPFNFFHRGDDIRTDSSGKKVQLWVPLAITDITYAIGEEPLSDRYYHREKPLTLEDAYNKLEFLFYDQGVSLDDIFDYPDKISQTSGGDLIGDWFDYMDMCFTLGWTEYMPKDLYYRYNLAREALGKEPVVFMIQEYDVEAWARDPKQVEYFRRKGNQLEMYGVFPCDDEGNPVLRWVAVDVRNPVNIICKKKNELESLMTVTLGPKTVVRAKIQTQRDKIGEPLPDTEPEWVQLYAGPQNMSFNYKVLKDRRQELGYTQQQVADAVEANVRTYQKWENGETKPDGYYLLRILNWLDIPNINDIIVYGKE